MDTGEYSEDVTGARALLANMLERAFEVVQDNYTHQKMACLGKSSCHCKG